MATLDYSGDPETEHYRVFDKGRLRGEVKARRRDGMVIIVSDTPKEVSMGDIITLNHYCDRGNVGFARFNSIVSKRDLEIQKQEDQYNPVNFGALEQKVG